MEIIHLVRMGMKATIERSADKLWYYRIEDDNGKLIHDSQQAGESGSLRSTAAVSRANSHMKRIEQDRKAGVSR